MLIFRSQSAHYGVIAHKINFCRFLAWIDEAHGGLLSTAFNTKARLCLFFITVCATITSGHKAPTTAYKSKNTGLMNNQFRHY
ncbi:uncharacterized protein PHALS_06388 [Plasmopara halstedii]|uniref:Uncharacterized protein n=1 Tax=Plasmopara halstedii TaxID=4781 RepID=A0A0P1B2Q8_PLAHL|nr:uncharacterized protein PHALS_06388 [Plasmopara halstedii]CEG48572.1 hypothetical protein PHALS_06388 [Plasmopara halstedii]|eukprot:XP_024584941.1 hypothetical protein PHALS_06388 [Plasmopara halstedii]